MEMNQQLPYSWDLLPYVQYHVSHEQHTVEEETKTQEVVSSTEGTRDRIIIEYLTKNNID